MGEDSEIRKPEFFNTPLDESGVTDSEQTQVIPPQASPPRRRKRSATSRILEYIAIILGAILIAILVQGFVVKPFQIPSQSMQPTIEPGDRILVNRLSYRFGEIKQGDIIVFRSPNDPDTDFVKRVIAVGGDTIEIDNHMVIVNDEALVEDYIAPWVNPREPIYAKRTVDEGTVFVMGDNRDNSDDSRRWGFLDQDEIIGKAVAIYWPLSRIQRL